MKEKHQISLPRWICQIYLRRRMRSYLQETCKVQYKAGKIEEVRVCL